ncbi:MAG: trypsin-like peptidase domain-containing protein [Acidobacteriota bacterium]
MSKVRMLVGLLAATVFFGVLTLVFLPKDSLEKSKSPGRPATIPAQSQPRPSAAETKPAEAAAPPDLPALIKSVRDCVVTIQTYDSLDNAVSMGTGFFLSTSGVVTNYHVVAGAHHAEVKTKQGVARVDRASAGDQESDLAVLDVSSLVWRPTPLKPGSSMPEVGERVFVIGNPLGLECTVSDGIVSGKPAVDPIGTVIQITCPISPGSSGSPVFNMRGEVVGIASFQVVEGQNLNFAIPIAKATALKIGTGKEMAQLAPVDTKVLDAFKDPVQKAEYLYSIGHYDEAARLYEEVVHRDMKNAHMHYLLGRCLRQRWPERGLAELQIAIDINPRMADAYYEMGMANFAIHMEDESLIAFAEALKIDPSHFDALVGKASVYFYRKDYDRAAISLERALKIREEATALVHLGFCYENLERSADAIAALESALDLGEDSAEVLSGLAYNYVRIKNGSRASQYARRGLDKYPDDVGLHYVLGLAHLQNDDPSAAQEQLKWLFGFRSTGDLYDRKRELESELSRAISDYQRARR